MTNPLRFMRYGTTPQIVILALAWTAALVTVDYVKNPRALGSFFTQNVHVTTTGDVRTPEIVVTLNHLCCSGCLDDLQLALRPLGWIGKVEVQQGEKLPDQADVNINTVTGAQGYSGKVNLQVTDLKALDFVELDKTIRGMGLAPEKIEFGGVTHYRLEASLKHICCQLCTRALEEGMNLAKTFRATGQFNWIDSTEVNKEKRTIVVYARYSHVVDITEFLAALYHLGFAPASLRVMPGDET